ncbi:inhibitor of sigma-G Gin [Paenibacillus piri]|uniref:Inhibitor of sigma-G Gin n=1 Tax=Paenibacillus piri TaxID=2547395 RepID=A0A4R5K9E9_9BACL|nr:sigma factor G inhibitor Gin [Paenibacillus piri]TDF91619.1 inhibitor of sigma-G Gin [Paenibacillus piri]
MGEPSQETITHNCIICGQNKEQGIIIISEFICEDCEHEMVQTDVMDAKYPFFILQMKQILYKKDA